MVVEDFPRGGEDVAPLSPPPPPSPLRGDDPTCVPRDARVEKKAEPIALALRPEDTRKRSAVTTATVTADRHASSSDSRTHSQSRSTMGRRLRASNHGGGHMRTRISIRPHGTNSAHDVALRKKRLDAFSHAELLVLQALVASVARGAGERSRGDRELPLLKRHPFLARQRDVLSGVLSATDATAQRLLTEQGTQGDDDYAAVRDSKLKKALQMDYPAWRKKYFQKSVDRRLRLKRSDFEKLFPVIKDLPHGVSKRVFAVFDRNGSRKVEFTELCESLARCTRKNIVVSSHAVQDQAGGQEEEEDDRATLVFEWFMEKHEVKVTRPGLGQLEATLRAIERHYKLPKTRVLVPGSVNGVSSIEVTAKVLSDHLLAGQASVGQDDFYDRMVRLPEVLDVLMRPFDILTPVVAQHEILRQHETTQWRVGDAAYVLSASWWNRWRAHPHGSTTSRAENVSNQAEDKGDARTTAGDLGPINNESLCVADTDGVLKLGLKLGIDFVLVSSAVWRKLQLLYGGGPELPRKIIAQQDKPARGTSEEGTKDNQNVDDEEDESIDVDARVRVHLYPLVLNLRLMKTDTIQTSLLLARRFMLPASTKLKDLLHRLGLAPGVNTQSVSFWMRRHRWDVWRRIECSLDAPRSSLELVGVRSGHELIIDFKAFPSGSTSGKGQLFADNRFVLSLYQPIGNDFVCLEPGIDCAMTSANWNAQPVEATDEMGNAYDKQDSEDDRGAELYTGGHSGLITNTGFFVNMNEQFKFTKKPLPRLIGPTGGGTHSGGVRATGLLNMGNTCFLNCAIQCVGHSPVLREYFLSQRYLDDVNKVNTLGTKGKIASAYGRLMDALWSQLMEPQNCFAPAGFRDEFARHRTQFQESSQHDAHEFIVSLLDSLHEDLNRKRGGRSVTSGGGGFLCLPFTGSSRSGLDVIDDDAVSTSVLEDGSSTGSSSDEMIGSSAWQAHARVNSSVVVDLFHGQMRSETVCSSCDERKATFDPFLFFSVPIPEPKFIRAEVKILLQVRPSPTNPLSLISFPPTRQGFWLCRGSKVSDLCEEISHEYSIAARRFVIVEIRRNRIKRIFDEGETLESIAPFRDLYAFERAWGMEDIPVIPDQVVRVFGEPTVAEDALLLKQTEVVGFSDLRIGSRVDGLGFHGDWHPGSVIQVSTGTEGSAQGTNRALVHFDAFSSKWDKWFSEQDWSEGNVLPVHTKTKRSEEVFEVQVVHRRVIPFQRAAYMHSMPRGSTETASHDGSMLEVFGVPMFVTIASNRTGHELHGAILLQASRFIQAFEGVDASEAVPYETRVVDLDDVGSLLGVPLPRDSTCVLQHFATQSVIVLDWKVNAYHENDQQVKDRIPDEMVELEREHSNSTQNCESILSNSTSLTSCLDALFKAEEISLDDHWTCERCGVKREGTRRSDVWKLPDLVMIQLKRFQYQENGYRQKVRTMVDFPLHGLDFSQWMGKEGSGNHGSADPGCVYDLYAVANHVGGLARGHYTAYCKYDSDFEESARTFSAPARDRHHRGSAADSRFDDVWYRFDDEKVVEIAPSDIATEAAYVLFYKRRKLSPHNVLAYAM